MLLTNLCDIKDREYEILGLVEGSAVFSKNFGKDFMAGLKNMVGGELRDYTSMLNEAKNLSLSRVEELAHEFKADAVLNITHSVTNLQTGSALVVLTTGTAIRFI